MKCTYCGAAATRVVYSRSIRDGIKRRRQCLSCGVRFTTYERAASGVLFVVKKDGRREKYTREKLAAGIHKACEKLPMPMGAIEKAITNIESELYHSGKAEIHSSLIGDLVMQTLSKLDHIAYIRFASVYREFTDIGAFKEAVDTLLQSKTPSSTKSQIPHSTWLNKG